MHVCFCYVCFGFSVLSQEIGWEEHLENDLFCVKWGIKPWLNQTIHIVRGGTHLSVEEWRLLLVVSDHGS